ncbi:MAG: winged helix-turn-helix transcriptional regulator [Actinomycetota bacterium]|nr:winged helix-turn-helix transcriptional regulator [Actinomycetota bacterium]
MVAEIANLSITSRYAENSTDVIKLDTGNLTWMYEGKASDYESKEREGEIIDYLEQEGTASVKNIAEALGISSSRASRYLKGMVEDNRVNFVEDKTEGKGRPVKMYSLKEDTEKEF